MKKTILIPVIACLLVFTGCGKTLTKNDFINLHDKQFYLTKVFVTYSSGQAFYIKGVGVDNPSLHKDVFNALPYNQIFKALSDEYKIDINSDEFKNAAGKTEARWESEKTGINSISIICQLAEAPIQSGAFAVGLRINYTIILKTSTGALKEIKLSSPDEYNKFYTPEHFAKMKNAKVEDITRFIIFEELKKLPSKLSESIKSEK